MSPRLGRRAGGLAGRGGSTLGRVRRGGVGPAAQAFEPQVVTGEGKGCAEQGGEEAERAGEVAAPAADVDGVDPAAEFAGGRGVGVGGEGGEAAGGAVEGVVVGGALVAPSVGGDGGCAVGYADLAVVGAVGTKAGVDLLPRGEVGGVLDAVVLFITRAMSSAAAAFGAEGGVEGGAIPAEGPRQAGERHGQ